MYISYYFYSLYFNTDIFLFTFSELAGYLFVIDFRGIIDYFALLHGPFPTSQDSFETYRCKSGTADVAEDLNGEKRRVVTTAATWMT